MTRSEMEFLDNLFQGAKVYHTTTTGDSGSFIVKSSWSMGVGEFYKTYHIENQFEGKVKIIKIEINETIRKRIHDYILNKM